MQKSLSLIFSLSCCTLSNLLLANSVTAQEIDGDGTTDTQVTSDGNGNFTIEQGDRAGDNLFHSFDRFSVPTNGSASFNNATDITNIFNRVTGGNISNIDGLIKANGSANLFLVNPAGIMFGSNARLDIGGSFLGTTADSILFEDGTFSAVDLDNPPLLTINAPIGLNFRDNPAAIENQSRNVSNLNDEATFDDNLFGLRVPDGKTFALAGGNINADAGGIVAVGGRIELGAVAEAGILELTLAEDDLSFSFPDDLARANVSLTNNAGFLVSGNGGGDLTITANNIEILEGSGLFAGIFSGLGSVEAQAGDITIQASGSVLVEGITESNDFSSIFNTVGQNSIGNTGTLTINASRLAVENGGQVGIFVNGRGNGGDFFLNTTESISLDGASNNINAFTGVFNQVNFTGVGNSGLLEINTKQLEVFNNARISASTFGNGNSGLLLINASEMVSLDNSIVSSSIGDIAVGNSEGVSIKTPTLSLTNVAQILSNNFGTGNAGNITLDLENLIVENSGISNSTFSVGNSGNLTIDASNSIVLAGERPTLRNGAGSPGGLFAQVDAGGQGQAGNISINTDLLSVSDGSKVQVATFGNGDAGNLTVKANTVDIFNTSVFSDFTTGIFADVATDPLSENPSQGIGGNIQIETNILRLIDGGKITASTTGVGDAGNIIIEAKESIEISGIDPDGDGASLLGAEVAPSAVGSAGDIAVDTGSLTISNEGRVSTISLGSGTAGEIDIQANSISLSNGGGIDAATQSNLGEGANISLLVANEITLEDNSFISAQAFNDAAGGNVSIDTDFIIAFPNQVEGNGSDIIAKAVERNGGRINITAESLLGIRERRAIDNNQSNDIDASSDFGLDGTVSIFTPNINPIQGTTELPTNPVDLERGVVRACSNSQQTEETNSFIVRGRGGVPAAPTAPLSSNSITANEKFISHQNSDRGILTAKGEIIPARGVVKTEDGRILLTATSASENRRSLSGLQNCNGV